MANPRTSTSSTDVKINEVVIHPSSGRGEDITSIVNVINIHEDLFLPVITGSVQLIDGRALRSCQTPVRICEGRAITTIEGLSEDGSHPVQKAWEEIGVPQCGYCHPGQMIALTGLLNQSKKPSAEQISSVMSQQLCRCGTYHRIEQAVNRAIELSNQ